jgi:predicted amidohydrolase
MSHPRRVAVVQRQPRSADPQANLGAVADVLGRLAGAVDVVVFPELFLSGYLTDGLDRIAEPLDGPLVGALSGLARRHRTLLVCGLPEAADGRWFDTAVVLDADGTLAGAYRKTHLFGTEPAVFTPGDRLPVFDTGVGRVGVLICYDLEFPEPARVLAAQGAELLVVPTANMDPYADLHRVHARARAMENGVHLLLANQVGMVGDLVMCGGSRIVADTGEVLAAAGRGEALLLAELPDAADGARDPALDYFAHRRPDLYRAAPGDG